VDQTVDQIEAEIGRTRARLGSNVRELEQKVDAATDWEAQFRARPYTLLGAACLGGLLLGATLRSRGPRGHSALRATSAMGAGETRRGFDPRGQIGDLWDDVATALMGVASAKVRDYIAELVPDFDEHYARASQRAPAR
jgi:hypothetical protein